MKLIFSLLFVLAFISCDKMPNFSNFSTTPRSSCYSEQNNLLIERYTFPKDTFKIMDNYYVITDVWVSHNFKGGSKTEIYKEYVRFFCSFKNTVTGEYFIDHSKVVSPLYDHIRNSVTGNANHGFMGLGNDYSHYTFDFKNKDVLALPDTITITIVDAYEKGKETPIYMFKYASLYK